MKNIVHGRFLRCPEGYTAYIPSPLPPPLAWSGDIVHQLSRADQLLGQMAGEGRRLPNPHILIRPFLKREAVDSSRIEGTQTTLGELLAVEAGAQVDRNPEDLKEVGNYVVALEYGLKRLKSLPLSLRLTREIHEKLMRGVRGDHSTPGQFRRSQNWIGPPGSTLATATYVPPPPHELMNCLGEWEKFLHGKNLPTLIQAALMHYQFEAIHPFLDGNGRVGRLLITLLLVEKEVLPSPLLYLSSFFEATRLDYYRSLLGVTRRGEWGQWLEYFLFGVISQAKDSLARFEKINGLVQSWKTALAGHTSGVRMKLIDLLSENPYITAKGATAKLKVAFSSVQRGIDSLVQKKVIEQVNKGKRDRVYCAKTFLAILDQPPQFERNNL